MNKLIYIFFFILLYSCQSSIEKETKEFINTKVVFPSQGLCKGYYSMYTDTTVKYEYELVKFITSEACTSCKLNAIVNEEKYAKDHKINNLGMTYVISTSSDNYSNLLSLLYSERTEACVYIDTCNAFISTNPQIPNNEMFHTFVINREGKVLMVGSPFQNKKMEALFEKVIAKEHKKHKEIKKSV